MAWLRQLTWSAKYQSPAQIAFQLRQFRVLRLGFLQNGDLRIGIFPEGEEILIRGLGFRGVARHGISTSNTEMGDCSQWEVENDTAMIEKLPELSSSGCAVMRCQLEMPTQRKMSRSRYEVISM